MTHRPEDTLDPADWQEFSRIAHAVVDEGIDYVRGVRDRGLPGLGQRGGAAAARRFRHPVGDVVT